MNQVGCKTLFAQEHGRLIQGGAVNVDANDLTVEVMIPTAQLTKPSTGCQKEYGFSAAGVY